MHCYCPSCGNRAEYSASKPNFCSKCGEAFDKAFRRPTSTTASLQPPTSPNPFGHTPDVPVLDPHSVRVETTTGDKLTFDTLRANKGGLSFGRLAARQETSLEGVKPLSQARNEFLAEMLKDAPRIQAVQQANTATASVPIETATKPRARKIGATRSKRK